MGPIFIEIYYVVYVGCLYKTSYIFLIKFQYIKMHQLLTKMNRK